MEKLKLLISPEDIQLKIKEIAQKIERDFPEDPIVFIGVLKGSFIFLADLVRALNKRNIEIDFVRVKSYGYSDTSSGEVLITKDIEVPLEGKNVILVEDIVDTGLTLQFLLKHIAIHKPKTLKICAFINKLERKKIDIPLDYLGFTIESGFLVGYGLDYAERYRNLPGLYEVIKNE